MEKGYNFGEFLARCMVKQKARDLVWTQRKSQVS